MIELLQHILDLSDGEIPHVLSISWSDSKNSLPYAYATRSEICLLRWRQGGGYPSSYSRGQGSLRHERGGLLSQTDSVFYIASFT